MTRLVAALPRCASVVESFLDSGTKLATPRFRAFAVPGFLTWYYLSKMLEEKCVKVW
ncbi:MAG TPA: hypothetical protein VGK99_05595 [Acidobacteriota bacterium]